MVFTIDFSEKDRIEFIHSSNASINGREVELKSNREKNKIIKGKIEEIASKF